MNQSGRQDKDVDVLEPAQLPNTASTEVSNIDKHDLKLGKSSLNRGKSEFKVLIDHRQILKKKIAFCGVAAH